MRKITAIVLLAGLCAAAAAGGTDACKVLMMGTEADQPTLRTLIVGNSGGMITAADYVNVASWVFRRPDSLLTLGYKTILTYGENSLAGGAAAFGDTLAKFVDLGGGVVNMTYTFHGSGERAIGGRYKNAYLAVPYGVIYGSYPCALTILQSGHAIMNGVTAISNATGQGQHTSVAHPTYTVRVANWTNGSYVQCAAFDSLGRRTVALNWHPRDYASMSGQWLQQLVNALAWVAPLDHDVRPSAMVLPRYWVPVSTPMRCTVKVSNAGRNQESNIPVYCRIIDSLTGAVVHFSSNTTGTLAPGATVKVVMPVGWPPDGGTYDVTFYTALSGDQDQSNDTLKYKVRVVSPLKVLMMGTDGDQPAIRASIVSNSGGVITAVDYYNAASLPFARPDTLLTRGYKVILTCGGGNLAVGPASFGDTLAKFVDLGGSVVNMTYSFHGTSGCAIAGRYRDAYLAVPYGINYGTYPCRLGTVYQAGHPVMNGVDYIGNASGQGYHTSLGLHPAYTVRVADWSSGPYIQCAAFDSAGKRTAALNYHLKNCSTATGQGVQQVINALAWTRPVLPGAGVVSPAGGEIWQSGVNHLVTWASSNSGADSVVATDGAEFRLIAVQRPPASRAVLWPVSGTPGPNWRIQLFATGAGGTTMVQSPNFSIVAPPSGIALTAPVGGENWQAGVTHDVTWNSTGSAKDSLVYTTNGTTWNYLTVQTPPIAHTCAWTIPNSPSAACKVRVYARSADPQAPLVLAQSPANFNIVAAPSGVSMTSPNGGETWQVGVVHTAAWTSAGSVKDSLIYTVDGTNWSYLTVQTPPIAHSFAWTMPGTPSTTCRVRVIARSADPLAPSVSAQSATNFSIVAAPTAGITAPNGGEVWEVGWHHDVVWTSANSATDSVVYTTDGTNWIDLTRQSPPGTHSYDWTIPNSPSTACRARVFAIGPDALAPKVSVRGAGNFTIAAVPAVELTAPNGGEAWFSGSNRDITWTSVNSNTDSIVWSADNGSTWSFVDKQTTPITHSYAWTVPGTCGSDNLVRVFAIGSATTVSDQSNATFTILSPIAAWSSQTEVPLGGKNKSIKDGGALAYGKEGVGGQEEGVGGQGAGVGVSFLNPGTPGPRNPSFANDTGYVYAFKGNNRYEFYRYNTLSNVWVSRESIPAVNRLNKKKAVKKGSSLVMAGDGKLYATKGNNTLDWWQYSPGAGGSGSGVWVQKADVPTGAKNCKEGVSSAAVQEGADSYVYLLRGSGTFDFYRYNTATDAWDITLPTAPGGLKGKPYKNGSSITHDGDDTIYCLKGSYNEFAAYSISGKNWVTKDPLPLVAPPGTKKKKVKDGSGMAYAGNIVYALKGGNTNEFWTYKTDDDKWYTATELPTGSKRVKGGGALVVAKDMSALYAFRGNNTREFWKYGPIGTFSYPFPAGNQPKSIQGNSPFIVHRFALSVTPNPFTQSLNASISYSLPTSGNVSLRLYDITGKLVTTLARGYTTAGSHSALVNAGQLARGIYVLKFETDSYSTTEKLIIE